MAKKEKKLTELVTEIDEVEFERGIINALREIQDHKNQILTLMEDVYYYKKKGYDIKYYYNKKSNELSYHAEKKNKPKLGFR